MRRVLRSWVAAGLAILVIAGGGLALWAFAESGSEEADLGTALVSAGILGILLVVFERSLAQRADRVERTISISAGAEPAVDEWRPDPQSQEVDGPTREKQTMSSAEFVAKLDCWQRDHKRVDAEQVRIRVFRSGDYFQFFVGVVPGIDFDLVRQQRRDITLTQFRRALAQLTIELARDAIREGLVPLPNPQSAFEVFPPAAEAMQIAPDQPDSDYEPGDEINSWIE